MKDNKLGRIEAICFFVRNFETARDHFENAWGFVPKRIQPTIENPNFIEYKFYDATIALWERGAVADIMGEENLMEEGHNFMTAIKLPTMDDVDIVCNELKSKGVVCISEPETFSFGSRAAYMKDIEGNIWELFAWEEGGDGPALQ